LSKQPAVNNLADKYYLTLVIRLLVDQQGKLQHGDVVDLSEKRVGQFRKLEVIPSLVTRWLNAWARGQSAPDLDNLL
jgi:hypothetical protein